MRVSKSSHLPNIKQARAMRIAVARAVILTESFLCHVKKRAAILIRINAEVYKIASSLLKTPSDFQRPDEMIHPCSPKTEKQLQGKRQ